MESLLTSHPRVTLVCTLFSHINCSERPFLPCPHPKSRMFSPGYSVFSSGHFLPTVTIWKGLVCAFVICVSYQIQAGDLSVLSGISLKKLDKCMTKWMVFSWSWIEWPYPQSPTSKTRPRELAEHRGAIPLYVTEWLSSQLFREVSWLVLEGYSLPFRLFGGSGGFLNLIATTIPFPVVCLFLSVVPQHVQGGQRTT